MSAAPAPRLHGEIETPQPLRAQSGKVSITGWCLVEGVAEAPPVRLATSAGLLPMTRRTVRADVPGKWPNQPAAANCGFVIEGRLPAGVYLARVEARLSDGTWGSFKVLSLAVGPAALSGGIESPVDRGTISQRVHLEGWAVHPDQPICGLSLRYGHQEVTCEIGRTRDDVALIHPETPGAATPGFCSTVILSAGRGPLRLKARLSDGSVAIADTRVNIDIQTDENIGSEIDLAGERIVLPGYGRRRIEGSVARAVRPLNVLYVLPGSFASNSALHVAALANELSAAGHDCAVAVPHDAATLAYHEAPAFRGLGYAEAEAGAAFANGRGPDLIHAWTSRENVRQLTEKLRAKHQARVTVHLEDNEPELLAVALGRTVAELATMPAAELDRLVPADLSHPRRSREFLAAADGVTIITPRLQELAPTGAPCHLISPAADARYFFPRPVPREFRRVLDLEPGTSVLFYHGNVHASNAGEVRELYAAVLRLNQEGQPTALIRTGLDQVAFLGELAGDVAPHVLELGQVLHHRHLPPLMALADMFVQPGRADAFNDYRFPSKLPEFFSIGRPVVLPRSNLGTTLRHGVDAYVFEHADAAGIAQAVRELRADPALAARLATGASDYAARNFSWRKSAAALATYYATLAA